MSQVKPMLKLRLLNEAQKICEVIIPSREQIMRARKEAVGISTDHGSETKPSSPSLSVPYSHPHPSDSSLMSLIEKDVDEVQMQIQSKVSISNSKGKWRSNSLTRGPSSAPSFSPFSSLSSASFSQNRYLSGSSNRSRSITPSKSSFKSLLFPHSLISNRCWRNVMNVMCVGESISKKAWLVIHLKKETLDWSGWEKGKKKWSGWKQREGEREVEIYGMKGKWDGRVGGSNFFTFIPHVFLTFQSHFIHILFLDTIHSFIMCWNSWQIQMPFHHLHLPLFSLWYFFYISLSKSYKFSKICSPEEMQMMCKTHQTSIEGERVEKTQMVGRQVVRY